MSFLRRALSTEEELRSTLAEPADWLWDAFGGTKTASGKSVNQRTALELDAVWACVALLARSCGQMPLIVYRGEGRERERARSSPQWKLLHEQPNPMTQPDAWVETALAHLNLWGNYYAEKVKSSSSGRPIVGELWTLPPAKVHVERDAKGNKRFEVDGHPRILTSSEILHIPAFGYDGLVGLSPIGFFRSTLGTEASREEWAGRWYANAAMPGGYLKTDKTLDQAGAARLKSRWEAMHRGLRNFGRTAVLEDGVEWKQMSMPMADQQFIEQNRFGVNRIARIFQVPPEKIGGDRASSSITYSNIQSYNLDFVIFSLQHWLVRFEQGLKFDPDIFPEGLGLYPEFLLDGFLRGDPAARAAFYEKMHAMKALLVNEIRERENLPPLEGGDDFPDPPAVAPPPAADELEPGTTNGAGDPARVPAPAPSAGS